MYARGASGKTSLPPTRDKFIQISPGVYTHDIQDDGPPEVRITYRKLSNEAVLQEKIEALDTTYLIRQWGSVEKALSAFGGDRRIVDYKCNWSGD
jgi:hypothetical protein